MVYRAVDQGGQVRLELDPAFLPQVCGQPGEVGVIRSFDKLRTGLAYNLGNFMRRPVLPESMKHWTLTSLQTRLIKTGGRLVRYAKRLVFQLAEVLVTREISLIWGIPA